MHASGPPGVTTRNGARHATATGIHAGRCSGRRVRPLRQHLPDCNALAGRSFQLHDADGIDLTSHVAISTLPQEVGRTYGRAGHAAAQRCLFSADTADSHPLAGTAVHAGCEPVGTVLPDQAALSLLCMRVADARLAHYAPPPKAGDNGFIHAAAYWAILLPATSPASQSSAPPCPRRQGKHNGQQLQLSIARPATGAVRHSRPPAGAGSYTDEIDAFKRPTARHYRDSPSMAAF